MVERDDRAVVATFLAERVPEAPESADLSEDAAHHVRVRRLSPGDRVAVTDGRGRKAAGSLAVVAKNRVSVELEEAWSVPAPPTVHLLAPIGDRERMLWLAEKGVELGLTSWRPVLWRRSASVHPRGSGESFVGKVRARMISALEQSGGAWLPEVRPEVRGAELQQAIDGQGIRLLLDPTGEPLLRRPLAAPVTIALGPEGGLEPAEREMLVAAGFTAVSLAGNILRFETAGVAALAVVRAALAAAATVHGA
jgi:16S rRNA (uracil1498-N3)-methyltransferase